MFFFRISTINMIFYFLTIPKNLYLYLDNNKLNEIPKEIKRMNKLIIK
jgi:Leucine-rich repeat (LRR) protein